MLFSILHIFSYQRADVISHTRFLIGYLVGSWLGSRYLLFFWFYTRFILTSIFLTSSDSKASCLLVFIPSPAILSQENLVKITIPYTPFLCHIFSACFYPVGYGFSLHPIFFSLPLINFRQDWSLPEPAGFSFLWHNHGQWSVFVKAHEGNTTRKAWRFPEMTACRPGLDKDMQRNTFATGKLMPGAEWG